MKLLSFFFVVLLSSCCIAVPANAITWGEPDEHHDNVGAIVIDFPGYGLIPLCSGTLIHPRVFLTAGHCTRNIESLGEGTLYVNFEPDALNPQKLIPVADVVTHPQYDGGTPRSNPWDVGILILAEPVTDVVPAILPGEGFLDELLMNDLLKKHGDKATITVVGYGGTLNWPPPEITYDNIRQFALSEMRALLTTWLVMTQNNATDNGGTCYGDSGGPAFYTEPDNTEILVGITSWGDTPCVATGFYYRADIRETLDFIDEVIGSLPE